MSTHKGRCQQQRRPIDQGPTVPPTPALCKKRKAQLVDMQDAVTGNLRHFLLDATKRKLLLSWLRGIRERELQKIYTDPLFGSPPREQIEEVLLEQVRLLLRKKEQAA